jgi:hypothetical protein
MSQEPAQRQSLSATRSARARLSDGNEFAKNDMEDGQNESDSASAAP